jgi:hypothetical protein
VNPTEYDNRWHTSQSTNAWLAPAASARMHLAPVAASAAMRRQLLECLPHYGDVVGGGFAAGVAGPQQHRERLADAVFSSLSSCLCMKIVLGVSGGRG